MKPRKKRSVHDRYEEPGFKTNTPRTNCLHICSGCGKAFDDYFKMEKCEQSHEPNKSAWELGAAE